MKLNNIIEHRHITPETLRTLCIKSDWYTLGDNDEYSKMLCMCRNPDYTFAELTVKLIARIAKDIQRHSEVGQDDETLLYIMSSIAQVSSIYYTTEE